MNAWKRTKLAVGKGWILIYFWLEEKRLREMQRMSDSCIDFKRLIVSSRILFHFVPLRFLSTLIIINISTTIIIIIYLFSCIYSLPSSRNSASKRFLSSLLSTPEKAGDMYRPVALLLKALQISLRCLLCFLSLRRLCWGKDS